MKHFFYVLIISILTISCSKTEKSTSPPVIIKLTSCDSVKQGLLKISTTNDTIRLVSCIMITGCDSIRLGILEPTKANSDRLGCVVTQIGQYYLGGILAYIFKPGELRYDAKRVHGIIAAKIDLKIGTSFFIRWDKGIKSVLANGTIIGSGFTNTNTIISAYGANDTSYAAGLARAYNGGGYNDWFLPSKDELNALYLNKNTIGVSFINYGEQNKIIQSGFVPNWYWSSSEYFTGRVWIQRFTDGAQNIGYTGGSNTYYVRAIRYF
jgi:hypothetical protein